MLMNRQSARLSLGLIMLVLGATNVSAHHVMGGRMPATFVEGMLSGLGHPVIGLDHFAAVVAVGCLAAVHPAAGALVIAFVVAMMGGVALHLQGASMPGAEILVALTVIALGALMLRPAKCRQARRSCCLPWSDSCTATRWANRYTAPRRRRFMPTFSV